MVKSEKMVEDNQPEIKITDADRYQWLCKNRGYSNKDIDAMIISEIVHGK